MKNKITLLFFLSKTILFQASENEVTHTQKKLEINFLGETFACQKSEYSYLIEERKLDTSTLRVYAISEDPKVSDEAKAYFKKAYSAACLDCYTLRLALNARRLLMNFEEIVSVFSSQDRLLTINLKKGEPGSLIAVRYHQSFVSADFSQAPMFFDTKISNVEDKYVEKFLAKRIEKNSYKKLRGDKDYYTPEQRKKMSNIFLCLRSGNISFPEDKIAVAKYENEK